MVRPSRARAAVSTFAALAIAGCTTIAGLDGDYVVGEPSESGPSTASAGGGPGAGGAPTGTATSVSSSSAGGRGGAPSQGGGGMGGMGGPIAQVPCVADQLCPPGHVCCVADDTNAKLGCAAQPGDCVGSFGVACDGAEDCPPGDVCCGVWAGHWTQIQCQSSCNGSADRVICGGTTPPQGYCSGQSCSESSALPGYYWCDPD